ncbi:MAG: hypothetical protein M3137_01795 [Actinomycetota bacterium]|nr:hypothetical protein [Actinomycetota bacterium]
MADRVNVDPVGRTDLARRLRTALDTALHTVEAMAGADFPVAGPEETSGTVRELLVDKMVAETAMLLLCAAPVQSLDDSLAEAVRQVTARLAPLARRDATLAAVCLEPASARNHGLGHLVVSRLGHPDPGTDRLLAASLATGAGLGPERLPHRDMEQAWLSRLWGRGTHAAQTDDGLTARSALGRPLDVLGGTRLDFYAFTHAVMYGSDLGGRAPALPRSVAAVAADADAALACSLDAGDFDLTAEILLTWPMLRLAWSPAATFAFHLLTSVEEELGFLPGSAAELARYRSQFAGTRATYAPVTQYHTAYVMGFLCAASMRHGCAPPAHVPAAPKPTGAGLAVRELVDSGESPCQWMAAFDSLDPSQQDAVAPLALTVALRRGRDRGDMGAVRRALETAVAYDVVDGPAPQQAGSLLRRFAVLSHVRD